MPGEKSRQITYGKTGSSALVKISIHFHYNNGLSLFGLQLLNGFL